MTGFGRAEASDENRRPAKEVLPDAVGPKSTKTGMRGKLILFSFPNGIQLGL